ncbi:EAL domain-containing protein [Emcibacter nanhaiensis]|uniref:EAL domain-containing protein n=1 Tax=Emcibacter nanhaiensis TaxID=1505037 RepID=A0A501PP18_9PROT|nr:EAL domain-containing protein [Emcibacter nanhaiensis]TPD61511.1 EAL domain-containing protein [Emcibacter nanhaiensis]
MLPEKNNAYAESSATPSQVAELYHKARSLKRHHKGYRAIHLHFSLLDRMHKQPVNRRNIATAFNPLVQRHDGHLYWNDNFDLFFICRDAPLTVLDKAILDARRAVKSSPVLKEYLDAGRDTELCDWYNLDEDFEKFYSLVENLYNGTEAEVEQKPSSSPLTSLQQMVKSLKRREEPAEPAVRKAPQPTTRPKYETIFKRTEIPPMGPMELDKLERGLQNIDMLPMVSTQDACVIVGESRPQTVFSELFISVDEVSKKILPGYNMHADKWLFQRLTRSFDHKLMGVLASGFGDPATVRSININVDTVMTREFDKFVAAYKNISSQPLILEMKLFDVLSDVNAYYDAQKKLSGYSYKISIDAMDLQSIGILDRRLLNVDFLKIYWRKSYTRVLQDETRRALLEALKNHGQMRIVLCHCDSEEAIRFGQNMGLHMFQGHYVDKLLEG